MSAPIEARPIRQSPRSTTGLHFACYDEDQCLYIVYGHTEPHWVYYDGRVGMCDCGDFLNTTATCKHVLVIHEERGSSATG